MRSMHQPSHLEALKAPSGLALAECISKGSGAKIRLPANVEMVAWPQNGT